MHSCCALLLRPKRGCQAFARRGVPLASVHNVGVLVARRGSLLISWAISTSLGTMRCGHTARVCLFGMVLVLGPCPGRAATYQVGPTRTYKSVLALPSLAAGDVVEIDSATYNEVKRWTASGSASQPIVIRGAGVTKPVFDATKQIVDGVLPYPH